MEDLNCDLILDGGMPLGVIKYQNGCDLEVGFSYSLKFVLRKRFEFARFTWGVVMGKKKFVDLVCDLEDA